MAKGRHKRGKNDNREQIYMISLLPPAGSVVSVATSPRVSRRYIKRHDELPLGIESWSDEQIEALPWTVDSRRPKTWERALILLAHHRSQLALDLIEQMRDRVPLPLREFYELALAEAKGWLGMSFIQDGEDLEYLNPTA